MSHVLAAPDFDPALIARYDSAGPCYTSYPTAPQLLLLDADGRIVARSNIIGRTDPEFVAAVRKLAGG